MRIETTRFGPMEIDQSKIIHFPSGLLGFPDTKDYIIFDHDRDVPFKWLQAIDEPGLAFVIMDPFLVQPDYQVDSLDVDLRDLEVKDTEHVALFVILTIPPGDPTRITANLRGPVLVNEENRCAKQLVLSNSPYHTRHAIIPVQHGTREAAAER